MSDERHRQRGIELAFARLATASHRHAAAQRAALESADRRKYRCRDRHPGAQLRPAPALGDPDLRRAGGRLGGASAGAAASCWSAAPKPMSSISIGHCATATSPPCWNGSASWKPRVIGVDLYRDHPEPPGTERLAAVLAQKRRTLSGHSSSRVFLTAPVSPTRDVARHRSRGASPIRSPILKYCPPRFAVCR